MITSGGGNVFVNGSAPSFVPTGVVVTQGGQISAGGNGTVTINGEPSSLGGGIQISGFGSSIHSNGGAIDLQAGGSQAQVQLEDSATISSGNGNITISANSFVADGTSLINAGTGRVTLQPRTPGTQINLGGADVLSGPNRALGLSTSELNQITAASLHIGNAQTGNINLLAPITRTQALDLMLSSALSVRSALQGIDIDLNGGELSFGPGTRLAANVNGTTADTGYQQLRVNGTVDLTGLALTLTGNYRPAAGDVFDFIEADSITGSLSNDIATLNGERLRTSTTATTSSASHIPTPRSPAKQYRWSAANPLNVSASNGLLAGVSAGEGPLSLVELVLPAGYSGSFSADGAFQVTRTAPARTITFRYRISDGVSDFWFTGTIDSLLSTRLR
jgi:lipopolysaccharide export system protein LptA